MKSALVGLTVSMLGVLTTTLGHYSEWWSLSYLISLCIGAFISLTLLGESK